MRIAYVKKDSVHPNQEALLPLPDLEPVQGSKALTPSGTETFRRADAACPPSPIAPQGGSTVTVVQMPSSHLNWNIVNSYNSPADQIKGTGPFSRARFHSKSIDVDSRHDDKDKDDDIVVKRTSSFLQILAGKGKTTPKSADKEKEKDKEKKGFLNMGIFKRKKSVGIVDPTHSQKTLSSSSLPHTPEKDRCSTVFRLAFRHLVFVPRYCDYVVLADCHPVSLFLFLFLSLSSSLSLFYSIRADEKNHSSASDSPTRDDGMFHFSFPPASDKALLPSPPLPLHQWQPLTPLLFMLPTAFVEKDATVFPSRIARALSIGGSRPETDTGSSDPAGVGQTRARVGSLSRPEGLRSISTSHLPPPWDRAKGISAEMDTPKNTTSSPMSYAQAPHTQAAPSSSSSAYHPRHLDLLVKPKGWKLGDKLILNARAFTRGAAYYTNCKDRDREKERGSVGHRDRGDRSLARFLDRPHLLVAALLQLA